MNIKKAIFITILFALALYTGWTIIFGKNGFTTLRLFSQKKRVLLEQKTALESTKTSLEKKVKRLRGGSLDPDSIDENARKNLGYAKEGEKIYLE